MARPTKYNPEREKIIVETLTAGGTRRFAAERAGIDEMTFERWMKRYEAFAGAVRDAEAACELRCLLTLRQAAATDWKAALSWLERRRPNDWSRQSRVEIVATVRQMAEAEGLTAEETAELTSDIERYLKEQRGAGRR